jgi:PTH1 family peptidyl-tRNA hydrolase
MHLVVGLGNPGLEYRATRHNAGFLLIDVLAARWGIVLGDASPLACWGVGVAGTAPVLLAKPATFMNGSGDAVAALVRGHGANAVVVAYDDLDLPLGRVRIRPDGGAGGHRGVASVIAAVGTTFVRVRIGIGRPPTEVDPVDFVLTPFAPDERPALERALARAADGVEMLLRDGVDAAMRAINPAPLES